MNGTPSDIAYEQSGPKTALIVILLLIGASNIIGNLLVFLVVLANHRLQTITNYFLLSLCFTDLLASTVLIPFAVDAILNGDSVARVDTRVCGFLGLVDTVYATSSAFNAAAIALDRYQAIVHCFHYELRVTQRKTAIAITLIWLLAGIIGLCPVLGWGRYSFSTQQYMCTLQLPDRGGFLYVQITGCVLLPFAVMVCCYARIHIVAWRQVRQIRVHIQVQQGRRKVAGISTQKTRQVYVVIGLFALSWFPLFALKLARSINPSLHIPDALTTSATVLTLLSGTFNPFLYALRTSQFRLGLIRLFRIIRRKFLPKRVRPGAEGASTTISGRPRSKSASNIFQCPLPRRELARQGALSVAVIVHDLKTFGRESRLVSNCNGHYPATLQIPDTRSSKEAGQSPFPLLDDLGGLNGLRRPEKSGRQPRPASCHV